MIQFTKTKIAVIGGSKIIHNEKLLNGLKKLGKKIDIEKNIIQYGGGTVGMMCIIPREFDKNGGEVIGINWSYFKKRDAKENEIQEIIGKEIIMDEFRDRQHELIKTSDKFICLPGGIGTLSEVCDIIINNTGNLWEKPKTLIIYNFNDFYEPLKHMLNNFVKNNLLHHPENLHVHFVDNIDGILNLI